MDQRRTQLSEEVISLIRDYDNYVVRQDIEHGQSELENIHRSRNAISALREQIMSEQQELEINRGQQGLNESKFRAQMESKRAELEQQKAKHRELISREEAKILRAQGILDEEHAKLDQEHNTRRAAIESQSAEEKTEIQRKYQEQEGELRRIHAVEMEQIKQQYSVAQELQVTADAQIIQEQESGVAQILQNAKVKKAELETLQREHAAEMERTQTEHNESIARIVANTETSKTKITADIQTLHERYAQNQATAEARHRQDEENIRQGMETTAAAREEELRQLRAEHDAAAQEAVQVHEERLAQETDALQTEFNRQHDELVAQSRAALVEIQQVRHVEIARLEAERVAAVGALASESKDLDGVLLEIKTMQERIASVSLDKSKEMKKSSEFIQKFFKKLGIDHLKRTELNKLVNKLTALNISGDLQGIRSSFQENKKDMKDILINIMRIPSHRIGNEELDIVINIMKRNPDELVQNADKNELLDRIKTLEQELRKQQSREQQSREQQLRGQQPDEERTDSEEDYKIDEDLLTKLDKYQDTTRTKEELLEKEKIYNKIKEHCPLEHYCGPFSIKIYNFKNQKKIQNALLKCIDRLNKASNIKFALDIIKSKFHLTDEYMIATFYVTYELPGIDLDDIQVQTHNSTGKNITDVSGIKGKNIIVNFFNELHKNLSEDDYRHELNKDDYSDEAEEIKKQLPNINNDWIKNKIRKEAQNRLSKLIPFENLPSYIDN
jgi:hypothetical protein